MPIRRGEEWGRAAPLPAEGVVVRSDAEARAVVTAARRAGRPVPPLGLLGGDLCRTLGGSGDEARLWSADALTARADLGAVLLDGRLHWFVAHLVARHSWWRGRVVAAMSAQFLGRWDVAPRSHPGDGQLDLLDVDSSMSMGERWRARSRLPAGTHVPHPAITERRVRAAQVDLARPTPIWLDGEQVGTATSLSLRVEPDVLTVVV